MQTKITTKTEHGQTVTTIDVNGQQFSSLSIKNHEPIRQIIELAKTLTCHERRIIDDIINLLD